MEDVWRAHKSRVGKKCSPKKVNKGGCPKVEDYHIGFGSGFGLDFGV